MRVYAILSGFGGWVVTGHKPFAIHKAFGALGPLLAPRPNYATDVGHWFDTVGHDIKSSLVMHVSVNGNNFRHLVFSLTAGEGRRRVRGW